jgi:hypothetical protein
MWERGRGLAYKDQPRRASGWLVIFPMGKASARKPDTGVVLPAGRDSDVGTAAAHGHSYAGQ